VIIVVCIPYDTNGLKSTELRLAKGFSEFIFSKFDIMPKKRPRPTDKKITTALRNPLADYAAQIKENRTPDSRAVSETSLSKDIRLPLLGMEEEDDIDFVVDMGNFPHSKVLLSAANRKTIFSLDSKAQNLFLWIVFMLQFRMDTVILEYNRMKKLGYQASRNTFSDAIEALESKHIIQRINNVPKSLQYWHFFINPQMLFKGDAKTFYRHLIQVHPEWL
jgi:hypothetical protein